MQLRGEIVEKAVREIGVPLAEVARRMKKSRRHIYNMFENPHLSLDEILQIGKIIHYDFSGLFTYVSKSKSIVEEPQTPYGDSAAYWKDKYIALLEKYNALLERVTGWSSCQFVPLKHKVMSVKEMERWLGPNLADLLSKV